MSFLAKIGGIVLKGIAIASGFMPLVQQQFPQTSGAVTQFQGTLSKIAAIVVSIEAIGQLKGLPGAEKAKAAGPLVAQAILTSSLMVGQRIDNPTLFNQGCINIAGGVADVLNSLKPEGVKETQPPSS